MRGAIGEADLLEQRQRPLAQLRRADADRREAGLDVLERGQRRDQVELLEDEAERVQPQLGQLAVAETPRSRPSKKTLPALGRSSAPSSCSSVVLPDPLGPSSATNSPGLDLQVDAADGLDHRRATLEEPLGALDVVEHGRPLLDLPQRVGGTEPRGAERRRRRRRAGRRRRRAGIRRAARPTAIGAVSATWSLTRAGGHLRRGRRSRRRRPCSSSPSASGRRRRSRRPRRRRGRRRAGRRGRPARATRRRPGARRATASSRAP